MISPIDWAEKVVEDYRERLIVDPDNPILAFKASRDRYISQSRYAGLPYLGSWQSEDVVTWNVFRSLQKAGSLDIITNKIGIGQPRGLLLWTLAPEIDGVNAELQYVAGSLIRRFDGTLRGQVTEPDVIILGATGVGVIECKLSEPDKAPTHLWLPELEGEFGSVKKRRTIYQNEIPHLIKDGISNEEIALVYQLVRMAFYAMKLGASYGVVPVVASLANRGNWSREIHKLGKSASDLWGMFCEMLSKDSPRCEAIFWQDLRELMQGKPPLYTLSVYLSLSAYLSTHPCLK